MMESISQCELNNRFGVCARVLVSVSARSCASSVCLHRQAGSQAAVLMNLKRNTVSERFFSSFVGERFANETARGDFHVSN